MKVFISWSKPRSREVAAALRDWLRKVIQSCDPWMSSVDIEAGQRWSAEIESELEASSVGIICVTPENQAEPWLNFEAGAISKKIGKDRLSRVAPYLLNMKNEDLRQPLGQFQSKVADRDGTFELVRMVNGAQEKPLADPVLKATFDLWWPELEGKLKEIAQKAHPLTPKRSSDDKIDELLDLARAIARRLDEKEQSPVASGVGSPEWFVPHDLLLGVDEKPRLSKSLKEIEEALRTGKLQLKQSPPPIGNKGTGEGQGS